MTLLALTGGETALIVLAAFWGLLVLFLCLVLLNTFRVLEATRLTVDAMREETVPLLREIKGSVERTNGISIAWAACSIPSGVSWDASSGSRVCWSTPPPARS